MSIVYLNGEYMPLDQATVPVEERGFLFGDGIYEVVRLYQGRPFHLAQHLERWAHSAEGARLPLLNTCTELPRIIARLTTENHLQDAEVYVQYTRGSAHPRSHAFPAQMHPTLLVMPMDMHPPTPQVRAAGVSAISVPDLRWQRCDIKSVMLLPTVMAKQQAHEQGAFEAIQVRDGYVTEGASTNIGAVIDGSFVTHPLNHHILSGITLLATLTLADKLGIPVRREAFSVEQMYAAQELMLMSTTSEVLPITQVDGRLISTGRPGVVTQRLYDAFRRETAQGA